MPPTYQAERPGHNNVISEPVSSYNLENKIPTESLACYQNYANSSAEVVLSTQTTAAAGHPGHEQQMARVVICNLWVNMKDLRKNFWSLILFASLEASL